MFFKKAIKKISAVLTAGIIGLTLTFAPAPASTTSTASAAEMSLKESNTTLEGQNYWLNYWKKEKGVNSDPNKNARLHSMMTQLTNAVAKLDPSINDLPYVYFVNNDTSFNAFCTMAHVMSVNSGAFDLVANDDELAAIVGHEMGHGQKDHPYKGYKSAQQKVLWANIAGAVIGGGQLTNIAGNLLLTHSIAHGTKRNEKEADDLAFNYIVQTSYNPGACAAIWQRVMDKYESTGEQSKIEMFFNPSDHPNHLARRDKYVQKLYEYSGKHVTVKDGMVGVNSKEFIKPAATSNMSSEERAYFVLGNLAVAYHNGQDKYNATVSNGTVYLGNQAIITPASGDESAQAIADKLNSIK